jgi:hypothetical protein
MSAKRAAGYCGGAVLLLAWLASAGGLMQPTSYVEQPSTPVETSGTATLASDVQAQAARLKNRLSAAPAPQEPSRNPFTFAPRELPRRARRAPEPVQPVPQIVAPDDPAIELIGVAESRTPAGTVRTAVISAMNGELFLVKEGEVIAARFRVTTVGADAVELTDLASGTVRRLALRE